MLHSKSLQSLQDIRAMSKNTKDVAAMMLESRNKRKGITGGVAANVKKVYFTPEMCGK